MVVVGDAAHAAAPNAAQGASMAIEDSVVLAKCLRELPDAEGAFTAYERLRRERAEAIVAHSAATNDRAIGSTSAPARSPARSTEAAAGERSRQDGVAWQLDYRIDRDEAVPLD